MVTDTPLQRSRRDSSAALDGCFSVRVLPDDPESLPALNLGPFGDFLLRLSVVFLRSSTLALPYFSLRLLASSVHLFLTPLFVQSASCTNSMSIPSGPLAQMTCLASGAERGSDTNSTPAALSRATQAGTSSIIKVNQRTPA